MKQLLTYNRNMIMKMRTITPAHFLVTFVVCMSCPSTLHADGIPEPGLVMYGAVTNVNGGWPLPGVSVQWQVSGGGSVATVSTATANVNGAYFYIAQIPFETRSVSGGNFPAATNTLPLTDAVTTFNRSATAAGTNASIAPPALPAFNFSKAERGRVERVDLLVYFTPDAALDSDGDGVPNWAEQIAGTNPFDANSVFKASTDIQPAPGGGLIIKWSSVAGKIYSIHRTTNLGQSFTTLAANVPATAPLNQYTDSTATNAGPYFYRIQVNP